MTQDSVVIFDTTLRDGEQSPGATMTHAEKLEIAEIAKPARSCMNAIPTSSNKNPKMSNMQQKPRMA